jgi:hypothetical protein
MENVGIFLWSFGIYYGNLVYFISLFSGNLEILDSFGILSEEKSGNPGRVQNRPLWCTTIYIYSNAIVIKASLFSFFWLLLSKNFNKK